MTISSTLTRILEAVGQQKPGKKSFLGDHRQRLKEGLRSIYLKLSLALLYYLVAMSARGALRLRRLTEPLRAATAGEETLMRREAIGISGSKNGVKITESIAKSE